MISTAVLKILLLYFVIKFGTFSMTKISGLKKSTYFRYSRNNWFLGSSSVGFPVTERILASPIVEKVGQGGPPIITSTFWFPIISENFSGGI